MATQTDTPQSISGVERGGEWWMVQHRDNSDHGSGQHYFETEHEARAYAEKVRLDPPGGDHFHPAPQGDLQIRVFYLERVA